MGATYATFTWKDERTPEQRAADEARWRHQLKAEERKRQKEMERSRFYGYEKNPLDSPEKCGVELIAVLSDGGSYEYDMVILIRDLDTGKFYAAHDAGCSCPHPFEDLRELSDMTEIRSGRELEVFVSAQGPGREWTLEARQAFFRKARKALKS